MVNTFLPYADFDESAKALDYRRLGKQRVEALQILRANLGLTVGWVNHPAAKMWKGHEITLCKYGIAMCMEWRDRGFKDSCLDKFNAVLKEIAEKITKGKDHPDLTWITDRLEILPNWLGDESFHRSHQSNLMRKDPAFYSRHNWDVPDDLDYVWPLPGKIKVRNGNLDKLLQTQSLEDWELELLTND